MQNGWHICRTEDHNPRTIFSRNCIKCEIENMSAKEMTWWKPKKKIILHFKQSNVKNMRYFVTSWTNGYVFDAVWFKTKCAMVTQNIRDKQFDYDAKKKLLFAFYVIKRRWHKIEIHIKSN